MRLIDADSIEIPHFTLATDRIKMIDAIDEAPTIEPKRGEWIAHPTEKEWDVCTVCGTGCKRREIGYDTDFERPYVTEYGYPFCPNCGARMVGERESE